jgi:hypothetical protein
MQKKIITLLLASGFLSVAQASNDIDMDTSFDDTPVVTNQAPVFFNPQQFIPLNGLPSPVKRIEYYQIGKEFIPYKTKAGKKALDIYSQCIEVANDRLDKIMEDICISYLVTSVKGTNYGSNNLSDYVYFPNELYKDFLKKFGENNLRYYSEILFMPYYPNILKLEKNKDHLEQFQEDYFVSRKNW